MQHSAEMMRIIRDIDVVGAMRLHEHLWPQYPPSSEAETRVSLHYARTLMKEMSDDLRCYSHAWLRDRCLPSGLPDHLMQKAERMYPVVVGAVGISSSSVSGSKTSFNRAVEKIMSDAVLETYADGHRHQPEIVKARMMEKRADFKRRA